MTKSHGKFFFGHVDSLGLESGPQHQHQLPHQLPKQRKHVVPESQGWSTGGFFVVGKLSDEFSVVVSITKAVGDVNAIVTRSRVSDVFMVLSCIFQVDDC